MRFLVFLMLLSVFTGCDEQTVAAVSDQKDEIVVNTKCSAGSFSPDGEKIAWSAEKFKGLYSKDLSSGKVTDISTENMAGWKFSWAPDSSGIAFRERLENGKFTIMKRELEKDSNELVSEFSETVAPPIWKDSIYSVNTLRSSNISLAKKPVLNLKTPVRKLKFNAFTSSNRVSVINLSTGKIQNLPEGTHSPALSPDNSNLLFVEKNSIKGMNFNNGSITTIAQGSSPSWSGNSKIVFNQTIDDGRNITFSAVKLYDIKSQKISDISVESGRIPLFPSLSFDGNKLLYTDGVTGKLLIHNLTEKGRTL